MSAGSHAACHYLKRAVQAMSRTNDKESRTLDEQACAWCAVRSSCWLKTTENTSSLQKQQQAPTVYLHDAIDPRRWGGCQTAKHRTSFRRLLPATAASASETQPQRHVLHASEPCTCSKSREQGFGTHSRVEWLCNCRES